MEFGALAAFWLVSMMFVLTPGADWAYAIAAGIRGQAFPAVGGMLAVTWPPPEWWPPASRQWSPARPQR